ncbi:sugar ABC transporter substrate-binding protein [Kribbella sp. NPDC051770]|uniref:ABC transporter substrate-binding protein n=1 Tax=Kribbella sp. NPDC051770 TaxID=3155413 RepID=UPI0034121BB1
MNRTGKRLTALAAVPLLLAAFAACGSSDDSSGGKAGEKVEITFQEQFSDAETAQFEKQLASFSQANPNITVKLVRDNDKSYYDKLTTQIAGGKGPDVVRVEPPRATQFIASGWALPLDDTVQAKEYFPASLEPITKDGKLYGVPADLSALALFYRTDLLSAAGISTPPATWDEFTTAAKKLTNGKVKGAGLFGGWGGFEFYPWLWQSGADVLDKDQKTAVFNSPEAVKALQLWVDLQKDAMPAGMASATEDDLKGPFVSGTLGMMTSGPWMIPSLKTAGIDGKWAVAPLPKDQQEATVLGGLDLLVLKNSKHADAAKTFVKWLMDDAVQKEWASALGYIPVKTALYDDPVFKDDKYVSAFSAVLQQARSRPSVPQAGDIDTALGNAVQAALSGKKSPKDALDEAVEASNKALQ